ncbi:hypothetical protein [Maribacter stanieri]|uniref:hypothetical protein n=1 Tax=Maribacter stanieri TaxID=440514 RepID=UPI0030D8D690|tara:strand:+ start:58 stop:420 length:363 start_codon:yes stop_codon:yes gene_type:complete
MSIINKIAPLLFLTIGFVQINAQSSCSELMDMVTSEGYGYTYTSYSSDAISQVTFYEVDGDNYNTYYFAIVRFKSSYTDYIYQVGSRTKSNYAMNYLQSAGEAFWHYIQPYNQNLNCAPN